MNHLTYPRERTLGTITLVLGLIAWLGLIIGSFGIALVILALGFVLYLFAQSSLIAHIKGNGVELSEKQFPDLYSQFIRCCDQLEIKSRPQAYILNGNGGLNAFATKFLGTQYVVLMTDVVDAMDKHDDGVSFYIGHELGHLRKKHLSGGLLRWPVLWLPLLGAAYSRARETTCDRHGLACCKSPEGAARSLAALAAGVERWKDLDVISYVKQTNHTSGFWMSFHELTAGYPWLTKRAARVMDVEATMPKRSFISYILAAFVPFAGRLGSGFGVLILVYIIGVLAAIALPAYQQYTTKAVLAANIIQSQDTRDALGNYYENNQEIPESLSALNIKAELIDGSLMTLDTNNMALSVNTKKGEIIFTPAEDDQGKIIWGCINGEGLTPEQLPPSCISVEIK
ncbi:M48 family metalloprotease [Colwellia sp. Bg11-28]|uniref:M48 family metalloprotease n=1 Tax=Colwellia sp. Bg11-28 TaxID=2058305 RepID=UPI000C33CE04|nr:M48 family metalloprotease [Colwellia sp. Bg11-28]PKH88096.1 peptidase M48 [Colwellia sp. Bg11-28]